MPLHIGEAALCKEVSRRLLDECGMYATPINYPTVPRGEDRLRFTPTPLHTDAMMDRLVEALLSDPAPGASGRRRERRGTSSVAGAQLRSTDGIGAGRPQAELAPHPCGPARTGGRVTLDHGDVTTSRPATRLPAMTTETQPMIIELGHFALILALFVALVQSIVPLVGAARRQRRLDGGRPLGGADRSSR